MSTLTLPRPNIWRRLAALASLLLLGLVIVQTVANVLDEPLGLVVIFLLLGLAATAAWHAISRKGTRRLVAMLIALVALAAAIITAATPSLSSVLIRLAELAVALALSKFALTRDVRTLKSLETPGTPVPPATNGALIMNLRSGGGKAERFHLEDECRARGIEPIVLQQGDDLLELARNAIDGGADVIGMAGGDGSQALVASVASQRGIPMVVIPAGTRNHLALDLGLDREDVVGALDAFGVAREQTMDLAEVNGRVFVNNVSLGLYAEIVRSPEYRDAKADTTLTALPRMLGPGAEPFDLRFEGPDGVAHRGAHLIQVSNGPYGKGMSGMGTRPRLDTGLLGITTLVIPDDKAAGALIRAVGSGHPERYEGLTGWDAPTFGVDSGSTVAIGLDGETVELEPPLAFTSRPGVLRVRRPEHAIGYSPSALAPGHSMLVDLWRTILGKPIQIET